ncbi:MAG: hypothetical protein ACP5QY_00190 [Candidatus Hydrogenedens sp.]
MPHQKPTRYRYFLETDARGDTIEEFEQRWIESEGYKTNWGEQRLSSLLFYALLSSI